MILEWFSSPGWKTIPWMVSGVALFLFASSELLIHQRSAGWASYSLHTPCVASDIFTSRYDFTYSMQSKDGYRGIDPSVVKYRVFEEGKPIPYSVGGKRAFAAVFEGKRGRIYRIEAEISPRYAVKSDGIPHLSVQIDRDDSLRFQLFFNVLKAVGILLLGIGILGWSKRRITGNGSGTPSLSN